MISKLFVKICVVEEIRYNLEVLYPRFLCSIREEESF